MVLALLLLATASAQPAGETFTCTSTRVWDGECRFERSGRRKPRRPDRAGRSRFLPFPDTAGDTGKRNGWMAPCGIGLAATGAPVLLPGRAGSLRPSVALRRRAG